MVKNFIFNDIVLYAKGWYQRSENIVDDLAYLFEQIYGWVTADEGEIALRMLRVLDSLYKAMDLKQENYGMFNSHFLLEQGIRKCMSVYDVSRDMATIYVAMSVLQGLSKDEIKLNAPHYGKKEHFRMGTLFGKYNISMTYTEMNRRAQKAFGC